MSLTLFSLKDSAKFLILKPLLSPEVTPTRKYLRKLTKFDSLLLRLTLTELLPGTLGPINTPTVSEALSNT